MKVPIERPATVKYTRRMVRTWARRVIRGCIIQARRYNEDPELYVSYQRAWCILDLLDTLEHYDEMTLKVAKKETSR